MFFKIEDPLKREIVLSSGSWEHVQQRHPEFTTWKSLEITIQNPNIIGQNPDSRKPNRDIYYKLGALDVYPPLYVAVVVGFKGDQGSIVTAHLADDIRIGPGGYKYVSR